MGEFLLASVVLSAGLRLSMRCAATFGVTEADETLGAGGELGVAEGAKSAYDERSCGAGEGAMAIAALMLIVDGVQTRC